MTFGKKSYNGNYHNNEAIEKVPVPEKIKCVRCSKVKGPHSFSEKRLKELKETIFKSPGRFDPLISKVIACTMCTGGNVVELHCCRCDVTKDLDKFSKAQRRNPDKATCWSCMQALQNVEPGGRESDESDSDGSSRSNSSSDDDDSTFAGTFSGLSVSGGATVRSNYTSHTTSSTGGVNVNGSGIASPVASSNGRVTPPHLRKRVTGTASITSSNQTTPNPSLAGPRRGYAASTISNSTEQTSGGGKFAKVRATPSRVMYDVVQLERMMVPDHNEEDPDDEITAEASDDDDD